MWVMTLLPLGVVFDTLPNLGHILKKKSILMYVVHPRLKLLTGEIQLNLSTRPRLPPQCGVVEKLVLKPVFFHSSGSYTVTWIVKWPVSSIFEITTRFFYNIDYSFLEETLVVRYTHLPHHCVKVNYTRIYFPRWGNILSGTGNILSGQDLRWLV